MNDILRGQHAQLSRKIFTFHHKNILNLGAAHRYFYILFNCTFRRGAAPTFIQLQPPPFVLVQSISQAASRFFGRLGVSWAGLVWVRAPRGMVWDLGVGTGCDGDG